MADTSSLRLDTVTNSDRVVVIVRGDIDSVTAPQLHAVIDAVGEDTSIVELDFTELGFLDSTGVGVIAAALRRLELVNGKLVLSSVSASVKRLLFITNLLPYVEIRSERN